MKKIVFQLAWWLGCGLAAQAQVISQPVALPATTRHGWGFELNAGVRPRTGNFMALNQALVANGFAGDLPQQFNAIAVEQLFQGGGRWLVGWEVAFAGFGNTYGPANRTRMHRSYAEGSFMAGYDLVPHDGWRLAPIVGVGFNSISLDINDLQPKYDFAGLLRADNLDVNLNRTNLMLHAGLRFSHRIKVFEGHGTSEYTVNCQTVSREDFVYKVYVPVSLTIGYHWQPNPGQYWTATIGDRDTQQNPNDQNSNRVEGAPAVLNMSGLTATLSVGIGYWGRRTQ
ncbi:MAG: hypothetical protein MUC97_07830 [Bernardetiaceae bacterium]|jgi:hypothetical protein|nr:hypothetical protein [Bernardetiaceae bacterium]